MITIGARARRSPRARRPAHLLLPAVTLALFYVAHYTRLMRASMLEIYGMDYIRTARAKGSPSRGRLTRTSLRNALLPVVTLLGVQLGSLLGGVGPGRDRVRLARPRPARLRRRCSSATSTCCSAILFCRSVLVVLVNLVVDLSTASLDPRIEVGADAASTSGYALSRADRGRGRRRLRRSSP